VKVVKVEGKKVTLKAEEVVAECPLKPKWAASMVSIYGPDADLKGRLGRFSRCPEVLKLAGYEVVVEGSESEEKE